MCNLGFKFYAHTHTHTHTHARCAGGSVGKDLPARAGDVGLGRADPLEQEMAAHSSIPA